MRPKLKIKVFVFLLILKSRFRDVMGREDLMNIFLNTKFD